MTDDKTHLISIASGKGGVGKSVFVANMGASLAHAGVNVVVADLDTGGANLAYLFGLFRPQHTLSDFLRRSVESLEDVVVEVPGHRGLRVLPGAGETLATANPCHATKKRMLRHLRKLGADVVLIDIGAGSGLDALDYFLAADERLVVATPDPTSVLDAYRFIKLAGIRMVVNALVGRRSVKRTLAEQDFASVDEIVASLDEYLDGSNAADELRELVATTVAAYKPSLVLNRVDSQGMVNVKKLSSLLRRYCGGELDLLAEIPEDPAVRNSVRRYTLVTDTEPAAPASVAMKAAAKRVTSRLPVFDEPIP